MEATTVLPSGKEVKVSDHVWTIAEIAALIPEEDALKYPRYRLGALETARKEKPRHKNCGKIASAGRHVRARHSALFTRARKVDGRIGISVLAAADDFMFRLAGWGAIQLTAPFQRESNTVAVGAIPGRPSHPLPIHSPYRRPRPHHAQRH